MTAITAALSSRGKIVTPPAGRRRPAPRPLPLFWATLLCARFFAGARNHPLAVHRCRGDAARGRFDRKVDRGVGGDRDRDRVCRSSRWWKTRRQSSPLVGGGTPQIIKGQGLNLLRCDSTISLLRGGGGKEITDLEDVGGLENGIESSNSTSESCGSLSSMTSARDEESTAAAAAAATATTTAKSANNVDDEETVIQGNDLYDVNQKYALKRGTQTTGAGASGRNPSIFSAADAQIDASLVSLYYKRTAAALGQSPLLGEAMNGWRTNSKDERMNEKRNPMTGRLWARRSERGTLILKFPGGAGEAGGPPVYVELLEAKDGHDLDAEGGNTIRARYIADESHLSPAPSSPFAPVEGIYGAYDLPCSGPHVVLITESEEVYTSPLSMVRGDDDDVEKRRPLLELRRVKSMEIVPLREGDSHRRRHHRHRSRRFRTAMSNDPSNEHDEEQWAEEARQLHLLRDSFKEHDLYFVVPSQSNSAVVRDVTHSLQRSFLGSVAARNHVNGSPDNPVWWKPYAEDEALLASRSKGGDGSRTPCGRAVSADPRFFWNEEPMKMLLPLNAENSCQPPQALLRDHVVPVTSAFVGIRRGVPVPSSKETYDQVLISRRSKHRAGTRFTRRGADDNGAVANYAETEQIILVLRSGDDDDKNGKEECDEDGRDLGRCSDTLLEVYSHVQTRGSIPLHWSSPASVREYRPRVYVGVDPGVQARGVRKHLLGELRWYSSSSSSSNGKLEATARKKKARAKIAMVNLIDKHGDQGRLGRAFDSVLSGVLAAYSRSSLTAGASDSHHHPFLGPGSVEHIWYDFHAECKGGRWDRLADLLERTTPALDEQGYFCAVPNTLDHEDDGWAVLRTQDGVVRTNCMDCLDRTNVVQSIFARYALHRQLHERPGLSKAGGASPPTGRRRTLPLEHVVAYRRRPLALPWAEGETAHRHLWADNADTISRLYAGTPALKGDFTRTGRRTHRGAVDDGVNSLQRYYLNNFIDADRQEGMDLLVGSAGFHVLPSGGDSDDDDSDVYVLREQAKNTRKRLSRGYHESHARIKMEDGGDFLLGVTSSSVDGDEAGGETEDSYPSDILEHAKAVHSIDCGSSPRTAGKRAFAVSLMLLSKAPIPFAAIIATAIASRFSSK